MDDWQRSADFIQTNILNEFFSALKCLGKSWIWIHIMCKLIEAGCILKLFLLIRKQTEYIIIVVKNIICSIVYTLYNTIPEVLIVAHSRRSSTSDVPPHIHRTSTPIDANILLNTFAYGSNYSYVNIPLRILYWVLWKIK